MTSGSRTKAKKPPDVLGQSDEKVVELLTQLIREETHIVKQNMHEVEYQCNDDWTCRKVHHLYFDQPPARIAKMLADKLGLRRANARKDLSYPGYYCSSTGDHWVLAITHTFSAVLWDLGSPNAENARTLMVLA